MGCWLWKCMVAWWGGVQITEGPYVVGLTSLYSVLSCVHFSGSCFSRNGAA
jgi:hypothetical protein